MNTRYVLKECLQNEFPESSVATLKKWIKQKRVIVNGSFPKNLQESYSSIPQITLKSKGSYLNGSIPIVYEDEHIIVIDKPSGLLSVAKEKKSSINLHSIIKKHTKAPIVYPIHRLDKETSGLILFAYTKEARDVLKKAMEQRKIHREYLAVTEGHITPEEGTWESYLLETASLDVIVSKSEKARFAKTHYKVLKKTKKFSLINFRLETGRKHQIRVQAADAKIPVLGDKRYSDSERKFRLALHAFKLNFQHPINNKMLSFSSQAPQEFLHLFPSI